MAKERANNEKDKKVQFKEENVRILLLFTLIVALTTCYSFHTSNSNIVGTWEGSTSAGEVMITFSQKEVDVYIFSRSCFYRSRGIYSIERGFISTWEDDTGDESLLQFWREPFYVEEGTLTVANLTLTKVR